ncbi:hypothetical protein FJY68_01100 [candidate division WOR-3 bacterium]|uniref:Uncharacterized protein n=1 Tax=candidate division WOR-3 bacterium TaxID=2052148 RepID=A0A937XFE4_UNCW3|nr:hypothetical protein [candidate division WOR-3 bacterium]
MSKVFAETSTPPVAGKAVCCVIGPVGDPGTPVRLRADLVFERIFSPAADHCGFSAWRADRSVLPGRIPDEVLHHLYDDPVVIADLTGNNGSVAYELAVRDFYGKPTVAVIDEGQRIPFYQSQVRVIRISHLTEEAIERSVASVSASIGDAVRAAVVADSPFAEAVRLRDTRLSGAEAKGVYLYCVDLDLHRQIRDFLAGHGVAIVARDERQGRLGGTPALMREICCQAAAAVVVMRRDARGQPLSDTDYVLGAAQAAFGMDRVIAMLEVGAGWQGHLAGYWHGFRRDPLDLSSLRLRLLEMGLVK